MTLIKMKAIGMSALCLLAFSCDHAPEKPAVASEMDQIIKAVDGLKIPIEEKLLTEYYPEAVEGDFLVNFNGTGIDDASLLKKGYRASLVGDKEKPVAIIFYNPPSEFYLIPFKGVTHLERPRNLTKLGYRFYLIESNRSGRGVHGTELK